MLTEIKDPEKLKVIAAEAVLKYTDQIEINRQLRQHLSTVEAERDRLKSENERLLKLIDEILNHALANRNTEHEFFVCYTYYGRAMPEWVQRAKAALRREVSDGKD